MPVDGDALRSWRRSRGWDVPEMARRPRRNAPDSDPVPVHDAPVRMIRRWEREGLRTERYELLCAAVLEIEPDQLEEGFGYEIREGGDGSAPLFRPVAQAVDLGTWLESTNVGEATVTYLAATSQRLSGDYTHQPPLAVLKDAIELQQRITALLRGGRQRLAQTRDLCKAGAEVFAVLALLCGDIGQYASAEAYSHAGWICAQEAGSGLESAYVFSAQAKTAQWQKRYAEAMARARQGYEICPPAGARVLLACQEANAAQALGDIARAREALSRARAAQTP